jgi:hypothetical protein
MECGTGLAAGGGFAEAVDRPKSQRRAAVDPCANRRHDTTGATAFMRRRLRLAALGAGVSQPRVSERQQPMDVRRPGRATARSRVSTRQHSSKAAEQSTWAEHSTAKHRKAKQSTATHTCMQHCSQHCSQQHSASTRRLPMSIIMITITTANTILIWPPLCYKHDQHTPPAPVCR